MTGARIEVTVDDAEARAALARLVARAEDLTPVMDEIGGALVLSTQRRFELGAGPGGLAWKPSQRALAEGGKTLVDTARLLASLTHRAGRDRVDVGTNVVYAAIHQFGGPAGRGLKTTLPARPFLGLDDDDRREIVAIVGDAIRGAWAGT